MFDRKVKCASDFDSTDHDLKFIRSIPLNNVEIVNQDFPGNFNF